MEKGGDRGLRLPIIRMKMRFFCGFPGRLSLARSLARRGDRARNRGAYARAAAMYRKALRHDPTRTDIYIQYGHMSKEIGRYEEAEAAYRCALSRSPGDGEIHLQFGHLLKLTGQVEQATEAFKEAQRLLPDNAIPSAELQNLGGARRTESASLSDESEYEVHIRAGDRLRDAYRYADAAQTYGAALALAPFRTDVRVQYANMLRGDGRFARVLFIGLRCQETRGGKWGFGFTTTVSTLHSGAGPASPPIPAC